MPFGFLVIFFDRFEKGWKILSEPQQSLVTKDGLVPPIEVAQHPGPSVFPSAVISTENVIDQIGDGRSLLEPSHEKEEHLFGVDGVSTCVSALIVVAIVDANLIVDVR